MMAALALGVISARALISNLEIRIGDDTDASDTGALALRKTGLVGAECPLYIDMAMLAPRGLVTSAETVRGRVGLPDRGLAGEEDTSLRRIVA